MFLFYHGSSCGDTITHRPGQEEKDLPKSPVGITIVLSIDLSHL
jgi:hypothetical protein